jgi:endo-1,4-beta-xylanase
MSGYWQLEQPDVPAGGFMTNYPKLTYATILAVLLGLLAWPALIRAQALTEREILSGANARIAKYRTGEATLRVLDASGRAIRKGSKIEIEQTRHKFLFGSNIFMLGKCRTPEQEQAYEDRFAALLNYATAPFYWWVYEPEKGKPDWPATQKIVAWCRAHGVTVKGHPLAWNTAEPRWLPDDLDQVMQLQLGRVTREVSHFKGQIDFWDAVNEATHYDREECRKNGPKLSAAIAKVDVQEYVRSVFRTARAANPSATLVINDYETGQEYADKVVSKLVDENGHPLYDVIGIQSHQHAGAWPVQKIWDTCERFAKFGKPIHFTETTFLSGQQGWELKKKDPNLQWVSTPEGEERQAEEVTRFYTILFSHPAVTAITWWDFTDQGSWQGAPAGLLRADMSPKPAYDALYQLVKGKWWTRTESTAGRKGMARFHGFYGDYRITVHDHDRTLSGRFSFDKVMATPIEVRLTVAK